MEMAAKGNGQKDRLLVSTSADSLRYQYRAYVCTMRQRRACCPAREEKQLGFSDPVQTSTAGNALDDSSCASVAIFSVAITMIWSRTRCARVNDFDGIDRFSCVVQVSGGDRCGDNAGVWWADGSMANGGVRAPGNNPIQMRAT